MSALALTRLPTPEDPPANQAQYLAAVIQPIVSFIVLGSIIVRKYCHGSVLVFVANLQGICTDGLSIPFFNMGRGVHSHTVSLTMTWTSRNRATVPDWVLWARRAPDVVESAVDEDVEQGSTRTPKDTDESAVNIPDTGPPDVLTFEDVSGDVVSVVTRRHSRGIDNSSPELVQVSVSFSIQST